MVNVCLIVQFTKNLKQIIKMIDVSVYKDILKMINNIATSIVVQILIQYLTKIMMDVSVLMDT